MKSIRLADRVAEALLTRIREDGLAPGDRLPTESELCDEFGVSRTVIREATRFLVARGVVEVRAGSGAVVAAIDSESATENLALFLEGRADAEYGAMHEVREVLEAESARRAAQRASDADLAALAESHRVFESLIDSDDIQALSHADLEFHAKLADASGNEILATLLEALGPTLIKPREVNLVHGPAREEAIRAHGRILAAVQAHDADAAEKAMRAHLSYVVERYAEYLPVARR
jgi:GntR family transcriptional regulator, transcriptional repressor for pyruvate dehydrogenase complex